MEVENPLLVEEHSLPRAHCQLPWLLEGEYISLIYIYISIYIVATRKKSLIGLIARCSHRTSPAGGRPTDVVTGRSGRVGKGSPLPGEEQIFLVVIFLEASYSHKPS